MRDVERARTRIMHASAHGRTWCSGSTRMATRYLQRGHRLRGARAMDGLKVLNSLADAGGPSDAGPAIGTSDGSESEMVGRCNIDGRCCLRKRKLDDEAFHAANSRGAWYIHGASYECGMAQATALFAVWLIG